MFIFTAEEILRLKQHAPDLFNAIEAERDRQSFDHDAYWARPRNAKWAQDQREELNHHIENARKAQ